MIIIIQGCDKTGKSTLAKQIANKFNMQYLHVGKPRTDNPLCQYQFIINNSKNVVIDRLHIGQNVYGPTYRNTMQMDFKNFQLKLKKKNVMCILCTDIVQNIMQRFIRQNQDFAKVEDIYSIISKFDQQTKNSLLVWYKYTIGDNKDYMYNIIDQKIKEEQYYFGK